ncbi:hypothetical protein [Arthrobacter sp. FW306-2-2C-D06B]|uniref:hypothetical protein n=1 Tax=Arthrobacter sp. FW306-2-2C-D06B TaxID=2879618 RepID=UPI003FA4CBFE|nr:hypothetical protein LFT47_13745 [Arthrobacter sp. FW306-2-2C-D06B]
MLEPGQFVVLDVGTTALSVARAIAGDFRGTVATNSLRVAIELSNHPDVVVHVAGAGSEKQRPGKSSFKLRRFVCLGRLIEIRTGSTSSSRRARGSSPSPNLSTPPCRVTPSRLLAAPTDCEPGIPGFGAVWAPKRCLT